MGDSGGKASEDSFHGHAHTGRKAHKFELSIIGRDFAKGFFFAVEFLILGFFPDVFDSSHKAIDVENYQVIVIMFEVQFT